jgi:rhodanese-related sulfurtransferase
LPARALLLALLAPVAACEEAGETDYPVLHGVFQIPARDLYERLMASPDRFVVIDVRLAYDYPRGHLPGAWSMPGAALVDPGSGDLIDGGRALTSIVPDRGRPVLFYCSEECGVSQVIAEVAVSMGYASAWHLAGGIDTWTGAGFHLEVRLEDFCLTGPVPPGPEDRIVDVRDDAAFAAGSIPGAISVPADSFIDAAGDEVDGARAWLSAVPIGPGRVWVLAGDREEARRVAVLAYRLRYFAVRTLDGPWTSWADGPCAGGPP